MAKLCDGYAIDCCTHSDPIQLILAAAAEQVKAGKQVQVICHDDDTAEQRLALFRLMPQNVDFPSGVILANTSLDQRQALREQTGAVFCSANELVLDLLRTRNLDRQRDDPVRRRLGFLTTDSQESQAATWIRTTPALVEDIDLLLVEGSISTVELHSTEQGTEEVVATTSLGRALEQIHSLAGTGYAFDEVTRQTLETYRIRTWQYASAPEPSITFLLTGATADACIPTLTAAVKRFSAEGRQVILDHCPDALQQVLTGALFETNVTQPVIMTRLFGVGDVSEFEQTLALVTVQPLESARLDRRRSWQLSSTHPDMVQCQLIQPVVDLGNGKWLPDWFPDGLRRKLAVRLLRRQQRLHDVKREQSRNAIRDYEQQVGNLIAYAGRR